MRKTILIALIGLLFVSCSNQQKENETASTITFKSGDSLEITADLYINNPKESPFIILFHQAAWSRGEYLEIAPKLNKLGFNCMAVDQRSGGQVNNIENETFKRAKSQKLATSYTDAEIDINAAIDYIKENYTSASKTIIWGSSYSSALVLKISGERKDIDAVLSFAPGEYFEDLGKPSNYVTQNAVKINFPVFITSAKSEKEYWWNIYNVIPSEKKYYFLPETEGQHGSRALWEQFPEHELYWKAVDKFLSTLK